MYTQSIKKYLKCPFLYQLYTIKYKYIYIPNKNVFVAGMTQQGY